MPSTSRPIGQRPACKKGALSRYIGRTKSGLNSKLHAVCDGLGSPIMMLLTEGQVSDHKGAVLLLSALLNAKELLADKRYDSDWFRTALTEYGIAPCIPPRKNHKVQYHYDKDL
jgi:transposase